MKPQHGRRGDPIWLPEVLRLFGVKVHEMPGWKDWGQGDFQEITHVIDHHTAGATTSASYIARNPGISNGLSSQIHLARDGLATLCGAGIAWHAGEDDTGKYMPGYVQRKTVTGWRSFTAANALSIGIEAVNAGDGTQPWPEVQLDAYARINAAICWYLGLPVSRVLGHKEIAPRRKIDPNFDMDMMRRRTQHYLDHPPFSKKKEIQVSVTSKIKSLINPSKSFTQQQFLALVDASVWRQEKVIRALAEKMGLDVDKIIEDAIKADNTRRGNM